MIERCAIAIMCKAPIAGRAKSRLRPALSAVQCATLAAAFLSDTVRTAQACGAHVLVSYWPSSVAAEQEIRVAAGHNVLVFAQQGNDLTERILHSFAVLFDQGYESAALINSDTPDLRVARLEAAVEAFRTCRDNPLVLGPTDDGGYYLVGCRCNARDQLQSIFAGVRWSTASALTDTVRNSEAAGIRTILLDSWNDIDTPADLLRLAARLQITPEAAPATTAVLDRLGYLPTMRDYLMVQKMGPPSRRWGHS